MSAPPIPLAFFSNALTRGGAEEHMLALLRGLDRERFRLFLVCPGEAADLLAGDVPPDVTLLRLTVRHPRQVREIVRLGAFFRREQIGILHSHLFYASLFGSPVARACGVPVIVETPHIHEFWRRGWKSSFFVDRLVGRCVDRYIAVSHANARYLIEQKGVPARKVQVIQNGADLRRFAAMPPAAPVRQALGYAPQEQVLLVIGRLAPQKGHAILLEALAALRREFPRVRLACVGEGALRQALQEQARAAGCQDIVRFAGYQRNIVEWLSAADVVVLPSLFEGLPLVAIEALAAGRPLVATAVDGTPEVVLDGQTGLTVAPNDPQALAEAIAALLRDPARAASLAAAGKALAGERFSEQRQIRETEELYLRAWAERAADGSPRREPWIGVEKPAEPPKGAKEGHAEGLADTDEIAAPARQAWLRETISGIAVRTCRQEWNQRLRSLVLTGSVARGEATIAGPPGDRRLMGDADFIAVFQPHAPLPSAKSVAALTARCDSALRSAGVTAHVSLAAVHDNYFRRLPAHIFTYELRHAGRVVYGDKSPLELIPDFSASAIDGEDAWRLLANRTIELLELAAGNMESPAGGPCVLEAGVQGSEPPGCREPCGPSDGNLAAAPQELHYRAVKLFLDMATSLLVFLGAYEPSYGRRAQRLQDMADRGEEGTVAPFALNAFARRVRECTRWKIAGGGECGGNLELCREALDYACQLWRWELAQLTAAPAVTPPEALFAGIASRQSAFQKLRGWLYAARRIGWLRGAPSWPRWLAMSARCTPRYYIYEAAWRLATGMAEIPGLRPAQSVPVLGGSAGLQPGNTRALRHGPLGPAESGAKALSFRSSLFTGQPGASTGPGPGVSTGNYTRPATCTGAGVLHEIRARLPVAYPNGRNHGEPTEQLARDLAWNYRTFLTETRA